MKKQPSPPNRRGRLVMLCFVLGLIFLVMLVGTVYLQHLLGRIHYVDSGTAPSLSPEELDAYLATQPEETNTSTFCSSVRIAGKTRPGRGRIP